MSSALDVIAMLLLPMAIVIAAYALAVYLVRLRQMQGVEVCAYAATAPDPAIGPTFFL